MGLWQPFGVGSTASRPKSRGSVFKHEFLGTLSTWHGIFCFILLNINYPDRLVLRCTLEYVGMVSEQCILREGPCSQGAS